MARGAALAVQLTALAAIALSPLAARATTDQDMATLNRASETFDKGDKRDALALAEGVLGHAPNDVNALYRSAYFNFGLNNLDAARGLLERLVKISGSNFYAWQLMVQVTQAQGDVARRDDAVEHLKISISSAIDPDLRAKADFIRDRIPVGDRALYAIDYFLAGGSDFTRYQFVLGEVGKSRDQGILLRTDAATTQNWSDTALLPPDKQLFHLDIVDQAPDGSEKVAIYHYYVDEPSYDVVRDDVLKVLRGEMPPMSGEPASVQGILKP